MFPTNNTNSNNTGSWQINSSNERDIIRAEIASVIKELFLDTVVDNTLPIMGDVTKVGTEGITDGTVKGSNMIGSKLPKAYDEKVQMIAKTFDERAKSGIGLTSDVVATYKDYIAEVIKTELGKYI